LFERLLDQTPAAVVFAEEHNEAVAAMALQYLTTAVSANDLTFLAGPQVRVARQALFADEGNDTAYTTFAEAAASDRIPVGLLRRTGYVLLRELIDCPPKHLSDSDRRTLWDLSPVLGACADPIKGVLAGSAGGAERWHQYTGWNPAMLADDNVRSNWPPGPTNNAGVMMRSDPDQLDALFETVSPVAAATGR
jgi:hypothetical protein